MNGMCKFIVLLTFVMLAGSAIAASDTVTYTYDSSGRLQSVAYANGTVITYSYDSAGNRQSVVTACSGSGC